MAIFVGTFFEGETILVLGGIAAYQGYLKLHWVMLFGCIGTILGDNLFFFLGRKHSKFMLVRRPLWKIRIVRASELIERFQTFLILIYRYLYGLRSVIPFALGMTPVSASRFVSLSAVGAVIWAIVVGGGGFFFGNALEMMIEKIKRYELAFFAVLAGIGLIIWLILYYRSTRTKPPPESQNKTQNGVQNKVVNNAERPDSLE